MALFGNRGSALRRDATKLWAAASLAEGVVISRTATGPEWRTIEDAMLDGFVTQLLDDGYLLETESHFVLAWDALFAAIDAAEYADLPTMLRLPPRTAARASLRSQHSLTDR